MTQSTPSTKTCKKCGESKPATWDFFGLKGPFNGEVHYADVCRACVSAKRKEYESTPEFKKRRNQRERDFRASNPEIARARDIKHSPDPEIGRERNSANNRRRRAQVAAVPSEPYTTQQVLDFYGTSCHLCLGKIDLSAPRSAYEGSNWEFGLHVDHVIPISKGGPDVLGNVRPSHAICNMKKGSRLST